MIKTYHKLNALLTALPTINNQEQQFIVVAIEYENQKRKFLAITFDELSKLITYLERNKRTFYEVLCQNKFCKFYLDIDVYTDTFIKINIDESLLILQNLFHYVIKSCINQFVSYTTSFVDHFLILSVSTETKHSYHLIYTNTFLRFESQSTISKFIQAILYYCADYILTHSCQKELIQDTNKASNMNAYNPLIKLQEIITQINLCDCIIPATTTTCNNFQKLLYKNSDGSYQWIFDHHVYNKNQQFRLYKSTKFGKNNPLVLINSCLFIQQNNHSHINTDKSDNQDIILDHALISHNKSTPNPLILSYNDNKWSMIDKAKNQFYDISSTNYFKCYHNSSTTIIPLDKISTTTSISTSISTHENDFTDFIIQLIHQKYNSTGYIQSCRHGNVNESLLFNNIGGPFRYCERLQRHHKSNQTCIIIDTFTYKYQIKCKDPDCKYYKPQWKNLYK